MEVRSSSGNEPRVVRLPGDLVTEIVARVPYRSLCRFKLVSRSWRALCSDPAVRRWCPQTLAGFFFRIMPLGPSSPGAPMVDPSFSFLPAGHRDACIIDSYNGLLLYKREDEACPRRRGLHPPHNVVDTAPHQAEGSLTCRRATNTPRRPAHRNTSVVHSRTSHKIVFVLVKAKENFELHLTGMEIYSSETGAWTYRQIEWGDGTVASWNSVFFKGTLHLTSPDSSSLLTVDIDANKWREIPTPRDFDFIGVSQGQLHAVHISNRYINNNNKERLSIWVLEDYAGQQWTLKHEVSERQMFGTLPRSFGGSCNFNVHAIHPDSGACLMSYNMDEKKVRFIWTLGDHSVSACPYVPCFSDWLPPGH
ncbi:hypothetical protein PVAP13_3KG329600 [Panicum virgatum]|uniref:F-box domain-containing protein n=1 Tax=Panicum virgatum TaxID=38727 RepID=A0A8T0UVE1_PANVG|nr:hypothetical protein PVAP13_3KG329600 [Panicum virgatum]